MPTKPRLFYFIGNLAHVTPISGDRINEIGLMKAMSVPFDVYYNGVLLEPGIEEYGRADGKIIMPKPGEYDLIYVRNNREFFLEAPSPKIYAASPYDKECFDAADAISCITPSWNDRLANYTSADYEFFDCMYPIDMKPPKRCLLMPQVVKSIPSDAQLANLKNDPVSLVESVDEKEKLGFIQRLRSFYSSLSSDKAKITMRHFGPLRASNFPHQLAFELERNKDLRKTVEAQCIGAGKKVTLPPSIKKMERVAQDEALRALAQTPFTWYNQHRSGAFAGSLKILEAMAMGVPVLAPRWHARVLELGGDYPFFWDPKSEIDFADPDQPDFRRALQKIIECTDQERLRVGQMLRERVQKHTAENVGKFLTKEFADYL